MIKLNITILTYNLDIQKVVWVAIYSQSITNIHLCLVEPVLSTTSINNGNKNGTILCRRFFAVANHGLNAIYSCAHLYKETSCGIHHFSEVTLCGLLLQG